MKYPLALAAVLLIAGCGGSAPPPAAPLELTRDTACALDGMLLADFPGPKAQIHYEGAAPEFFCDTMEMFAVYLRPEAQRPVRALFVQDMGKAEWDAPKGHWIDARSAFYVKDSKRRGAMGPTLASFAGEEDASAFAREHGGTVLRFADVRADMVALDGGVLNDRKM